MGYFLPPASCKMGVVLSPLGSGPDQPAYWINRPAPALLMRNLITTYFSRGRFGAVFGVPLAGPTALEISLKSTGLTVIDIKRTRTSPCCTAFVPASTQSESISGLPREPVAFIG